MNYCVDNTIIYEEFYYVNKNGDLFEVVVQREDFDFVSIDIISYNNEVENKERHDHIKPYHSEENSSLGNAKMTFYQLIDKL